MLIELTEWHVSLRNYFSKYTEHNAYLPFFNFSHLNFLRSLIVKAIAPIAGANIYT